MRVDGHLSLFTTHALPWVAPLPPPLSRPCPAHPAVSQAPTRPRQYNWSCFHCLFSRLCDLITSVCFDYVFSLSRDRNDCHLLHFHAEPPAVVCRPRERAVLLEGKDETALSSFSIHVFGALERAACLLFKRL